MKKAIIPVLFCLFVLVSARADVIYTDSFNYFDGPIIVNGTNSDGSTNWFHTGNATATDFFVHGHKAEVSATGGTLSRAEDVHCNFSTFTNTQTILYSSFTVNCTNLPTVTNYFAHFYVNGTTFQGRVAAAPGSLPGTWRLGVSGANAALSKIFPADLTTNIDYQVVMEWDPVTLFAGTLWVNPLSSSDLNVISADAVTAPPASLGFGLRQGSSFGSFFCAISNLVVATTFDEAATNVWSTNAVNPIIAFKPVGGTNFVGDPVTIVSLAAGQGQAGLTYQWQKNNANVANANGNSNVFAIASAVVSDTGNYRMIASTPFGLSATSTVAALWVTNAPIPPFFTVQPSNATVFFHQTATLTATADGPPPITYQWYYTNAPATGANVSGADSDTLTVTDVFTNNGTTGAYYLVASNPFGGKTSSIVNVIAVGPPIVSIAYLRTLVDPASFVATNSNLRWQATGTVSTYTNLTSGDTSSYYLQDGTGGINIFVTHGHDFRPPQGVSLTFIGWLSSFNSTLELEGDTNDLTTSFMINTNNDGSFISNSLPAPTVIPFGITNNLAQTEGLEGSIVMLTNVYFGTNAGNVLSTTANSTVEVTNAAGETFNLLFSSQDLDTAGQTLPDFAYSVIGVLNQSLGNAVSPRNQGYAIEVTRFSDIVTDAPPAVTVAISHAGKHSTLTWENVAWDNANFSYGSNYSYSILTSATAAGPYTVPSNYQASLLGINEVPANGSTGTGLGTVAVSPDQTTITVNLKFSGLSSAATAAHIHGPAAVGVNAAVLFPFTGVPNATSGAIPEQSFAITPTQLGYLQNGQLYFNVHSGNFAGGEIRGQVYLVPASGRTSGNTSLTNTSPTTAAYTDASAVGNVKFYRVTSP